MIIFVNRLLDTGLKVAREKLQESIPNTEKSKAKMTNTVLK